jgi:hypothetical protein
LFDEITFVNAVEGQGLENSKKDVIVNAYAIQTNNINGDKTDPQGVWEVVTNAAPSANTPTILTPYFEKKYSYMQNGLMVSWVFHDDGSVTVYAEGREMENTDPGEFVYEDGSVKYQDVVGTVSPDRKEVVFDQFTLVLDESDAYEFVPGLYETGAIDVFRMQGSGAIADMLIMSWDEMVDYGYMTVTDGELYHTPTSQASPIATYDAASCALEGDLLLPRDGSITSLAEGSFIYCEKLTGISLPSSITEIGSSSFRGCSSLNNVDFQGDTFLWEIIDKPSGSPWDKNVPATKVTCSDGYIQK